jgi:hypothetical protein
MRSNPEQRAPTFADATAAAGLCGTITTAAPDSVAMITRDSFVVIECAKDGCDPRPTDDREPTDPGVDWVPIEKPAT